MVECADSARLSVATATDCRYDANGDRRLELSEFERAVKADAIFLALGGARLTPALPIAAQETLVLANPRARTECPAAPHTPVACNRIGLGFAALGGALACSAQLSFTTSGLRSHASAVCACVGPARNSCLQPGRSATTTSDATDGLARSQTCEGLLASPEPTNTRVVDIRAALLGELYGHEQGQQKRARIGDDHTTEKGSPLHNAHGDEDWGDDDEGEEGWEEVRARVIAFACGVYK